MAYNDGFTGVCGDRVFMDAYYMYINLKSIESRSGQEKLDCCSFFVVAVRQCLSQINKLCTGESRSGYLDWLRWYSDVVTVEVESFRDSPDLQTIKLTLNGLLEDVNKLLQSYFQLNEAEKAVSNEYVHAFDRVDRDKSNESISIKIFQHAGRLLINYVKYLAEKKYLHNLDRPDKCFEQLKSEAEFLSTKLKDKDHEMANDILKVITQFENLRQQDEGLAKGHDIIMEQALRLAHSRATESRLLSAIRHIKETIKLLKQAAINKKNEAFKATAVLVEPFLNPKQTLSNLWYACKHPLKTLSEIINFAKNHPWKCGLMVLGAICIGGFVVAFPITFGAVAIHSACASLIPAAVAVYSTIFSGAAVVTALSLVSIAAGNVVKVNQNLDEKVVIEEAKIAALKAKNKDEERQISLKVMYDYFLRQRLREAKENAEREFQKMQELEQQAAALRQNQIKMLNAAQCEECESNLQKDCKELEDELKKTQSEFKKCHEKSRRAQVNVTKVQKGMNACMQLIEEPAESYKLPANWCRNYTTSQ